MSYDHEIVVKHFLGNISFKKRTVQVEENYKTSLKFTFNDLKDSIIALKKFSTEYDKGLRTLTLEDAKFIEDKSILILMINSVTAKESTTVIKQKKTNNRKEMTPIKAQGEGYEYSAHVVIDTNHDKTGTYNILVEKAETIDTNTFKLFVNKVLSKIAYDNSEKFTEKDTFTDKKIRFKPVLDIFSKPDEKFFEEIRRSTISDITLISDSFDDIVIPDTQKIVRPKEHQIKISTEVIKNDIFDYLESVGKFFSKARANDNTTFSKIKINYRNPESKKGKGSGTAIFNSENLLLDAKESVVTKKHVLNDFKNQIKNSYDEINTEIAHKMISILTGK